MQEETELIKYLKMITKFMSKNTNDLKYPCIEAFVLEHGHIMKSKPLPSNVDAGEMKMCFKNAHETAVLHGYDYVEGFAVSFIPVLHAWCVDNDNNVIDPTWEDGKAYYGVVFPLSYVSKTIVKRKAWGVLDAWDIGFPLLHGDKWV